MIYDWAAGFRTRNAYRMAPLSRALRCGTVRINAVDAYFPQAPWGVSNRPASAANRVGRGSRNTPNADTSMATTPGAPPNGSASRRPVRPDAASPGAV